MTGSAGVETGSTRQRAGKIRRHCARATRVVVTEACRRACNGADFIERAARETGLVLDVITPEEEARLAVAGCAPLLDPDDLMLQGRTALPVLRF